METTRLLIPEIKFSKILYCFFSQFSKIFVSRKNKFLKSIDFIDMFYWIIYKKKYRKKMNKKRKDKNVEK